jgi:myo-inositol-1(or 4)-monophosphatase
MSEALRAAATGMVVEPRVPSLAYRLARVGSGHVDAAFAGPNANDWDIAAADIILTEAGGILTDTDGMAPAYNRASPRHGGLVAAPAAVHGAALAAVREARARLQRKK